MIVKLSKTINISILQQVIDQKSKQNISELYKKNLVEHELFEFDDKLLM